MSRITGYGRGWQEPQASGRIARLLQIMREPATTATYLAAGFLVFLVFTVITVGGDLPIMKDGLALVDVRQRP